MMSAKKYFILSSGVFFIVGALHLVRAVLGWEMIIEGFDVAVWLSWIAVGALGILAYSGFMLFKK